MYRGNFFTTINQNNQQKSTPLVTGRMQIKTSARNRHTPLCHGKAKQNKITHMLASLASNERHQNPRPQLLGVEEMQLLTRPVLLSKVKHSSSTTHDPAALLRLSNASSENFLKIHIPVVTALLGQLKQASADESQTKHGVSGSWEGEQRLIPYFFVHMYEIPRE